MNDYNNKCRHVWGSIPQIASTTFQKIIHFGRVFYQKCPFLFGYLDK